MNLFDRIWFVWMNRRETSMSSRIAGMVFLLLCSIGVIIAGVITGLSILLLLGTIGTIIDTIVLAVLIVINWRKNTPRW
ncbi:hypothetical protein FACS1894132_02270 [Clostridia bacterium]|nr:hypothetical protein FACS1894132_02270 [Clostridia bacterium]